MAQSRVVESCVAEESVVDEHRAERRGVGGDGLHDLLCEQPAEYRARGRERAAPECRGRRARRRRRLRRAGRGATVRQLQQLVQREVRARAQLLRRQSRERALHAFEQRAVVPVAILLFKLEQS